MKPAIIDKRMPPEAKGRLSREWELIEIETRGIVYDAISGHPDIFMCQSPQGLIVAPNLPEVYLTAFASQGIQYWLGQFPVGSAYPESAAYNAVCTSQLLIHRVDSTDPVIKNRNSSAMVVNVRQGYTRCNLLVLPGKRFITSDRGIAKQLLQYEFEVLYVSPQGIVLPGESYGFFGGCCGIHGDRLYVTGSLRRYDFYENLKSFTEKSGLRITELYDGPLWDTGGIFFPGGET